MRELKYLAKYKHFKNKKKYIVLGVSEPVIKGELKNRQYEFPIVCQNTETNEDIRIFQFRDNKRCHVKTECESKLVIYMELYDSFRRYVRPYDVFMSEVDKEKYPNAKQKYRFELMED
ncbi:MAG: DUF1653 domain-containing protein [Terrisporobacter othiniensis]|nr:DUF1653 domain-containing protein [Terrisporobacter othiniensis]